MATFELIKLLGYYTNIVSVECGEELASLKIRLKNPIHQLFIWNLRIPGLVKIAQVKSNQSENEYILTFNCGSTAIGVSEALVNYRKFRLNEEKE